MKNLTPEMIAKAKTAKSAEELLELAKENGVELTEEEAKTYFAQLSAKGAVSDDELDVVAGGCDLFNAKARSIVANAPFRFVDGSTCPNCNCDEAKAVQKPIGMVAVCLNCGTDLGKRPTVDNVELI